MELDPLMWFILIGETVILSVSKCGECWRNQIFILGAAVIR